MTATNRLLITVLATVVAAGAFYMLGLKPKHQQAADLQSQITKQQQALDAARQLLAANEQARQQYRTAYATVVRLGKAVPADDDVRSLVIQLNSAARDTNVDFRSIDVTSGSSSAPVSSTAATGSATPATQAVTLPPGATVGPAGFPIMPFTFSFKGSFFDLGSFFRKVEAFVRTRGGNVKVDGRLLTLDALQLQPDATGFPHIRATVNATSYLVSPLEGATGGATAASPSPTTSTAPAPTATPTTSSGTTTATTATSTGAIR